MARPSSINPQVRAHILMLYAPPYSMSAGAIAAHLGTTKGVVCGLLFRAARAGEIVLRREMAPGLIATVDGVRSFTPRPPEERRLRNRPATPAQAAVPAGPAEGGEPAAPPREQKEEGVGPALLPPPPRPPVVVFRPRRAGQCCWPLWATGEKPTHQYCCAPAISGRPYCEEHRLRAVDTMKMAAILERRRLRPREGQHAVAIPAP